MTQAHKHADLLWSAQPDAAMVIFETQVSDMRRRDLVGATLLLLILILMLAAAAVGVIVAFILNTGADAPSTRTLWIMFGFGVFISFFVMGFLAMPLLRKLNPPVIYAVTEQGVGRRAGKDGPWQEEAPWREISDIQAWTTPGGYRAFSFQQNRQHPEHGMVSRHIRFSGLSDEDAEGLEKILQKLGRPTLECAAPQKP